MGTFTCGIGTFCWRVGSVGRCLIDGLIRLRIIIPTEDVLIRWVNVGDVSLLVDRLGFPAEGDERNDFIVEELHLDE